MCRLETGEFVDHIRWTQTPHRWPKLEHLGRDARVVMNTVLRPSHYLTKIVGSRGKPIVPPREVGKSPHLALALFPNKTEINKPGSERPAVETETAPNLSQRLRIGSLRDTDDDTLGVFHIPSNTAVWSAECAEIEQRVVPSLLP